MTEMKEQHQKLNAVSELIGGIVLVSNSTDKKRKRIIKRLQQVISDLKTARLRLNKRSKRSDIT